MHSLRRHSPLLRSQAKPGVQFAQHPPVVARYIAVAPSVAPRPRAAWVYWYPLLPPQPSGQMANKPAQNSQPFPCATP